MSPPKPAKTPQIRRFSTSTVEVYERQKGSPGHPYNTRYALKFFSRFKQELFQSRVSPENLAISSQTRDARTRKLLMDPELRDIPALEETSELPTARGSTCYKFCTCFAFVSLTIAFGVLAFMFAYISDKSVTSVRKEISSLTDEVRDMQGKLYVMTGALEFISTGITGMQETQLSPVVVKSVIQNELEQYDADKTGRTDFALESAGGKIVSIGDTEPYSDSSYSTLLGISLCPERNGARSLIQASSLPGECWAFKGSKGSVVIKLLGAVYISGVSLEHTPRSISPNGDNTSAPKTFSVYGLKSKNDIRGAFLLGTFSYDANGPSIQYFDVQKSYANSFLLVELVVESNHGHKDFTCVYRLRIHGTLDTHVAAK